MLFANEGAAQVCLNPLFKVGAVKHYMRSSTSWLGYLNPLFKVGAVKRLVEIIIAQTIWSQSPFQSWGGQTLYAKFHQLARLSQSPFQSRGGQTLDSHWRKIRGSSQSPFQSRGGQTLQVRQVRRFRGLNPLFKVGAVKPSAWRGSGQAR